MLKLLALCFLATCFADFVEWQPPRLGGGSRHNRLGPLLSPSFLRGIPADARKKILKVLFDEDLPRAKQQAELESLVKELPEKNQDLYKKQQEGVKKHEEEAKKKAEEAIAKLSASSQELAKKILAAHENLELSRKQERDEVKKVFEGASEEVRKELASVFPHRPRPLGKGRERLNKHTPEPHTDSAAEASTAANLATDAPAEGSTAANAATDAPVEASTADNAATDAAAEASTEPNLATDAAAEGSTADNAVTDAPAEASAAADAATDAPAN